MIKSKKTEIVSWLKDKLSRSNFVVLAEYRGMTDKQLYDMRVALKAKNCGVKISKNTLVKIVINGTSFEAIMPYLKGPVAILYSSDPVSLSKVLCDFAKRVEVLKIKTGYLDQALIAEDVIINLSKLGTIEEERAAFVGRIKAAQSNFVRIINAPKEGLASSFGSEN